MVRIFNPGFLIRHLESVFDHERRRQAYLLAAVCILIIAGKLVLIGLLGSPVPYYDQWPAEARQLYLPYLRGELGWNDLLARHNDHIILFTRVLNLGYLEVAGNWNPLFQMLMNIVLHMLCLGIFVRKFRSYFFGTASAPLLFLFAVLFALPFSSDNTLWGFQSQFYFVIMLSLIGVPLVAGSGAFSLQWCIGLVLGALSYLAMGAGVGVVLGMALFSALQLACQARKVSLAELAGLLLLLAITAFMIPGKTHLATATPFEFIWGFGLAGGWPVPLPVIGVLLANLPALWLTIVLIRQRERLGSADWTIIALLFWAGLQAALVSYGRPGGTVTARYFDIYAFIPLLNLISLLALHRRGAFGGNPVLQIVSIGWFAMILASLMLYALKFMPIEVSMNPLLVEARDVNITAFVRSGDAQALEKPFQQIPYDNPRTLRTLITQPEIIGILPARFGAPEHFRTKVREKLLLRGGLNLDPDLLKRIALLLGGGLMALCGAMAGLLLGYSALRTVQEATPRTKPSPG